MKSTTRVSQSQYQTIGRIPREIINQTVVYHQKSTLIEYSKIKS